MNFDDCIKRIIVNFEHDERDVIRYKLRGSIILYVNKKEKQWTKIFLKSVVREKSRYIFDICLTIRKKTSNKGPKYKINASKLTRKTYFVVGPSSFKDGIPVKYKKDKFACIYFNISEFAERKVKIKL